MTKKTKFILSIVCWVIALIVVVCWIVTYLRLFSMNQQQAVKYAAFYDIELSPTWTEDAIAPQLTAGIRRVTSHENAPVFNYFNFSKFDQQIERSIALFHLGYALLTAAFLTGGTTFTLLAFVKKRLNADDPLSAGEEAA